MKIKKMYESTKSIRGMLSTLCELRNAIFYQNREHTKTLIQLFNYNFIEIEYTDLFRNNDKIYVIQTSSNRYLEVEKDDMLKFKI